MSLQTLLIVVMLVVVVALALGWWIATRVKRDIDREPGVVSTVPREVRARPECVARLRAVSGEPLLLKRREGDLSFQIEDKALRPLATIPDRNVRAALREVAASLDADFGEVWVAIVRVAGESTLSVTRLA